MNQETNMIHTYTLSLKATAPLDALTGSNLQDQRLRLTTTGYAQSQTNKLLQGLTKIF